MSSRAAGRPTAAMARTPTGSAHYYQYQVMLKPSPPDLQELYLGSLAAIGIDPLKHDIRFVEDDWESPTLGAWGLGWEVWCDGMEVTQFTYFQQVGGFDCKPVAGRADLRARAAGDVHPGRRQCLRPQVQRRRRDLRRRLPRERAADVALEFRGRRHRDLVRRCSRRPRPSARIASPPSLPIPAYEQAIKASHIFNTLQARGVISVAERQAYIGRVRDLAKAACAAWMETQR